MAASTPRRFTGVSSASSTNLIEQRKQCTEISLENYVPAPCENCGTAFNGPLIAPWIDFIGMVEASMALHPVRI